MGIQFDQDIMEILSRLPVQYPVQFKWVSKLWKAIIFDPYFKMNHLHHAKNDRDSQKTSFYERSLKSGVSSMYCCPLSLVHRIVNVQKLDCPAISKITVYCSCNGLVIIHVIDSINECFIIMLWNPSAGESVVLPDPEFPLVEGSCLGLGYDPTSGDYKILKLCSDKDGSEVPGEILVLKSGSCRNIDKHPHGICNKVSGMGSALAFVNEAFHWIGMYGNHFEVSKTYSLVSFSISNEVYREIPLLEQILSLKGSFYISVSVLDGMLCVHSNFPKHTFQFWVLKDYGVKESWNALLTIDDPCIFQAVPKYRFGDGEVLFWSCILSAVGRIHLGHPEDNLAHPEDDIDHVMPFRMDLLLQKV
ncbi:hypothetical protein RND71_022300 [Anisodus tanguticus]|uniref:F-box associated beta-propeller type 3 domain-containing protein n=1 Tax=Anisodus tanguticus TaxID=243964 RepID=A0AAE1VDX0_9SOLA|nr:hypothetical protein RND71_022300 [Anisodus tanguticus]